MKRIQSTVLVFAALAVVAGCTVFKKNMQTTSSTLPAQSLWTGEYGGADKSYDSHLLVLREEIAPRFQQLAFEDRKTGRTIHYNLFIPKNYDPNQQYPLVLFMADASTVGKGVMASLKHGYGGIIWATDESQAKNPSFVLVPSFEGPENVTNDQWQVTDEADVALRLLQYIVGKYSIDKNRLYTTGQSMGGMISFYFNSRYPDLFAASLFVGSQWDVNVLSPLANKKFFYVVSAADPKASTGMKELGQMLSDKGVAYGETEFSARLPQAEQEAKVKELIRKGYGINFVRFSPNTVTPVNMKMKNGGEHMYSFDYAYRLEAVRDWLFKQKK
ncbi:MAG: alpha/beta hydrolase-fold protein [Prevotella sp.]|nr:alpha/beta hydrolase-fold protein [Prevotella sp.]